MTDEIRTLAQPSCWLCRGEGRVLYRGLRDRRFSAPGEWSVRICVDRNCALIWLDPMPAQVDIGKVYETYHTHQQSSAGGAARRAYRAVTDAWVLQHLGYGRGQAGPGGRMLSALARLLPGGADELGRVSMYLPKPTMPGLLLDVGCGNGDLMAQMRALGWKVEGVDLDPAAVQVARARGLAAREGTLEAARYRDASVDAITMSHVIEHVHDPRALLLECHRILRQGGTLVVVTPNTESLGHRRFRDAWYSLDPPRHLIMFRPATLRRVAESAGFSAARIRPTVYGARGIRLASRETRRTGRAIPDRLPSAREHLMSIPFQLRERLELRLGRPAGEELLMIATKD